MTRKDMNSIRHAAYLAWKATPEAQEALSRPYDHFCGWEITEHIHQGSAAGQSLTKFLVTEFDSQVNNSTLKAMGFTEGAEIKKLFSVDRKAQTLTPVGW